MRGFGSRIAALRVGSISTATAMLALALVHRSGLRFNITGSIPIGVYRVVDDTAPARRGDVVLACLPESVARLAHDRGYVPRGGSCPESLVPVGKMVMALAGDTVTVSNDGLRVNGRLVQNSRALTRDAAGRELRGIPSGRYPVSTGEVWLTGTSPRSFDSRYIGPVPVTNVIARLAQNYVSWRARDAHGPELHRDTGDQPSHVLDESSRRPGRSRSGRASSARLEEPWEVP